MATRDLTGLEAALQSVSFEASIQQHNDADVLNNPLDLCRSLLAELLSELIECEPSVAYRSIHWPNNIFNGDLTVTLPKLRSGSKPNEFGLEIRKKFPQDHPLFLPPIQDGVHLRIFISQDVLPRIFLPYISDRARAYGSHAEFEGKDLAASEKGRKKLLVEFSSPNIWSEIQGKHLRSTILGGYVSKVYKHMGWDVTSVNYLGDWGKNIALLKVGWDIFGDEQAYQADLIPHFLDIYHKVDELFKPEVAASKQARDEAAKAGTDEGEAQAQIENQGMYAERNAAFKKLENGDEDAVAFWKRARDINIASYVDFYAQLGVHFDEYSGESQVTAASMENVEKMLKEKSICEESAGALVVHMQQHGLRAGTAIIRDRTGATTYLLRDLAAFIERAERYSFDKMIVIAANDNNVHFSHVHHILVALGMKELAGKIQHLKFSEVSNMADKIGKCYKPQAIIDACQTAVEMELRTNEERSLVLGTSKETAKHLGISALLVNELATRTASAHLFDTAAMTAFKMGTGPELQYWYAKLQSILKDHAAGKDLSEADYESLAEDEPVDLLRTLIQYPEVTQASYNSLEPAGIITYIINVIEQLKACLSEDDNEEPEVDQTEENATADQAAQADADVSFTQGQLSLFEATRIVLENGMTLLGVAPLPKAELERADTPIAA
ncbi:hypothetical protein N0V90_003115 [Kalmusia sp. IMI 367209]|nr:hypothetical protein N0V90_003115 [Kalmusia sp. IMI 367209]